MGSRSIRAARTVVAAVLFLGLGLVGCSDLGDPIVELPVVRLPRIEGLLPDSGAVGDTFRVVGRDFGADPGAVLVGTRAGIVTSWADSTVRVVVPDSAVSASVQVRAGAGNSNRVPFRVSGTPSPLPELLSLRPARTVAGDTVRIGGLSFGEAPGDLEVRFAASSGDAAAQVVAWSDEEVSVLVPATARSGDVVVARGAQRSEPLAFDLAPELISFEDDLSNEIFGRQGCNSCHFGAGGLNGFSTLTPGDILRGGVHGRGAIPRDGAGSMVVRVVRGTFPGVRRMPDAGNPMPEEQILKLQDWIDQGMRDN